MRSLKKKLNIKKSTLKEAKGRQPRSKQIHLSELENKSQGNSILSPGSGSSILEGGVQRRHRALCRGPVSVQLGSFHS